MAKLKADFKEKWIEALLSGEYTQTRNRLKGTNPTTDEGIGFCCLGVACDLLQPNGWGRDARGRFEGGEEIFLGYIASIPNTLIKSIMEEGHFPETTLMKMNDVKKRTFPEIAAWIEENL